MRSAFMIAVLTSEAFLGYGYEGLTNNEIEEPVHRNPRAPPGFQRLSGKWSLEYEDETQNDTIKYTDEDETNDLWELLKRFSNLNGGKMGEDLK
ncbi:unnamed protein product [Cylicocyclus nassatus]|uniref:Uncharacterized protein n=1 Tax=Cylicocyclus nassatus TaxID=53992 RepID=A0AA36H529_CYLNA|nr:unnamed protein product [Cylicocyclus nassatus]